MLRRNFRRQLIVVCCFFICYLKPGHTYVDKSIINKYLNRIEGLANKMHLSTLVRKQSIIALYLSSRMNSSL